MKNNLTVFKNEQFGQVRMIDESGKVYFCGKDVATALGYADTVNAIKRHCKEKGVTKRHTLTNGGKQSIVFIDEGNLYRLITHSKLPEAEKFESWVFDEALPSIRKTGGYSVEEYRRQRAENARMRAETARINANTRQAKLLLKINEGRNPEKLEELKTLCSKFFGLTVDIMKVVQELNEIEEQPRKLLDKSETVMYSL